MLTSLELFGFKSFADRTLFEFSPGITCVVGPNGSGKSNVVDAIKWILGDQSPKSLRGKEMSDVIFNGSSSRKPAGFAEATLTFDNQSGLFPIEAEEVRFGRRLYRSGDSEYLLNGAAVRLKDIKDIFLGTGAGTAAYSIIEQGRVDQILQANPTTRRVVFEEAAGISRYKNRKVDAERKLEKVAQNLLRLTDIVDEVEAQLNATRSQASKAAKYRETSQELKQLWTGLAADDWRVLNAEIAHLAGQETTQEQELQTLAVQITSTETEKAALDSQLAEIDDELRQEERQVAAVREQLAARESTIRHQTSREAELSTEIERLRSDRVVLAAEAATVVRDLTETTERLQLFEDRVVTQRHALAERETACSRLQDELAEHQAWISQRRGDAEQVRQHIAQAERQTLRLNSQLESLEQTLGGLASQLTRLEDESRAAEEILQSRRTEVAAAEHRHQESLTNLEQARSQRQLLLDERLQLEQSLAKKRERRSAAVARIHVLEDLEKRQEGVSVGVREILRRAHDSPHAPWNEVVGSVGDLLQVALEHAPLVEVALGQRSQLVVVRRQQPIVEYLNRQAAPISGRVGFLELGRSPRGGFQAAGVAALDMLGQPGMVCRADELVEEIPEAAGLAAQLLADTWVTDSLDAAMTLAASHSGCRFVTQQGELVDQDGTVYAGTVPNTTALVYRRSELRDLKHEIIRLDRDLERGTERSEQLLTDLADAQSILATAELQTRTDHQQLTEVRSRADEQAREVERITAEYRRLEDQHVTHEQQQQTLQAELVQKQAEREQRQSESDHIEQDLAMAQERVRGVDGQLVQLRDELKTQQLELAKHDERLHSLRDVLARLTSDQQERVARREQANLRLLDVKQSLRQCRLTILRTRADLDHCFLEVEERSRIAKQFSLRRRDVRSGWSALAKEEELLHKRRRTAQDQRHQVEIRLRELRHNLAGLDERLREEYQTPLEEFVTQGLSAFRDFLAERSPESLTDQTVEIEVESVDDSEPLDEIDLIDAEQPAAVATGPDLEQLYTSGEIPFAEARPELEEQVNRLRRKLKLLGSVNTDALNELDDLESRFTHMSAQLQDLQEAKAALEDIIRRINKESRRIFLETFDSIRTNFRELFRKVFGGGEGDIILEDPENVLECGIDIVARPPGKELRSITLLSGGEKTMTAVALLFAMFKSKPSPYCILDEVDAALDEGNVDRYVNIIKEFAAGTQFVVITHRKRTMTAANVLYGVTMEQAGVSKRMSVRFEDVNDDGHIRAKGAA
ncbi:MAG: chromosome segregation protein SMC [Planctomycetaceae bacterium]